MIGEAPSFQTAVALLQRFARCDAHVLIEGETGTGKELAAREIHYGSPRHVRAFVPVSCGALPEALVENELFGHSSGAYTDAKSTQPGLVDLAEGGTLFLDEVDTLTRKGQVTLLRFLQDREYRPVGSARVRTADVRVVAATNASLQELVDAGRFRRDLLYRLNPLSVRLPPLRERAGDVALLAAHFVDAAARRLGCCHVPRLADGALARLEAYAWPGNVRELESVLFRAVLLSAGADLDADALVESAPDGVCRAAREPAPAPGPHEITLFSSAKSRALVEFERGYLTSLMRRSNGNVTLAARLSGTERRQLGKLLKKHGLGTRRAL
jgi:DNA-binding NtrC family response regulator